MGEVVREAAGVHVVEKIGDRVRCRRGVHFNVENADPRRGELHHLPGDAVNAGDLKIIPEINGRLAHGLHVGLVGDGSESGGQVGGLGGEPRGKGEDEQEK